MDIPKVVRIRRMNGAVVQDCDIHAHEVSREYIGSECKMGGWDLPQSKWHNPFSIKKYGSAEIAVEMFRKYIESNQQLIDSLHELRGKTLGCWCTPKPCHGDILVELFKKYHG